MNKISDILNKWYENNKQLIKLNDTKIKNIFNILVISIFSSFVTLVLSDQDIIYQYFNQDNKDLLFYRMIIFWIIIILVLSFFLGIVLKWINEKNTSRKTKAVLEFIVNILISGIYSSIALAIWWFIIVFGNIENNIDPERYIINWTGIAWIWFILIILFTLIIPVLFYKKNSNKTIK